MKFNSKCAFGFVLGYVFLGLFIIMLSKGNLFQLQGFLGWANTCLLCTIIIGWVFGK